MNDAVLDLLGMFTVVGTLATAGVSLEREIPVPPPVTGPLMVTVPVEDLPPSTLMGARLNELSAGVMVKDVCTVAPL